ncbi:uncharacterized protein LOC120357119 [Solenopsis invicta]|uniref:uncharacterized protein LOC120357119 n=1 Tax=Solenopsis invicta TaxID=13686 RepID=UPI00193DCE4B|nr:uncharacterized protein LOC120357119 [Solenopsis invicta]
MEFSVVPIFWLEEPNYCFWPQGMKNIRTAIVKGMAVQNNWIKCKCSVISKHATYELALDAEKHAIASSESENERQAGKRKVKHNKQNDFVEFVGPPKLVSHQKKNTTTKPLESNNNNFEAGDAEQNNEKDILADNITTAPTVIEQVDDDDNFSKFVIEFRRTMTDIQLQLQTLGNKQEQFQETVNIILTKINNEQYHKEDITIKDNKIGKFLPLTTIEDLLQLEDILKNDDEASMQVVNKVLLIGGKNEKDFLRRTLSAIFTDNLASMCSWTRQKNNFKVGDTQIIMSIKSKSVYDLCTSSHYCLPGVILLPYLSI